MTTTKTKTKKQTKLAPVRSLAHLSQLANDGDERYQKLAIATALNLGAHRFDCENFVDALRYLRNEANAVDDAGAITEEINLCRDGV